MASAPAAFSKVAWVSVQPVICHLRAEPVRVSAGVSLYLSLVTVASDVWGVIQSSFGACHLITLAFFVVCKVFI